MPVMRLATLPVERRSSTDRFRSRLHAVDDADSLTIMLERGRAALDAVAFASALSTAGSDVGHGDARRGRRTTRAERSRACTSTARIAVGIDPVFATGRHRPDRGIAARPSACPPRSRSRRRRIAESRSRCSPSSGFVHDAGRDVTGTRAPARRAAGRSRAGRRDHRRAGRASARSTSGRTISALGLGSRHTGCPPARSRRLRARRPCRRRRRDGDRRRRRGRAAARLRQHDDPRRRWRRSAGCRRSLPSAGEACRRR